MGHNRTEPGPSFASPSNDLCTHDAVDEGVVVEKDALESEDRAARPVDSNKQDEDYELQAMFYLPKRSPVFPPSTVKALPGAEEGLKVLLSNVAELLSRSPPPLDLHLDADVAASSPAAHCRPQQSFRVSFTLDVDDEDEDFLMITSGGNSPKADGKTSGDKQPTVKPHLKELLQDLGEKPADSPTWDEVFDKEDQDGDGAARDSGEEPDVQVVEFQSDDVEEDVSCREVIRKEEVTQGNSVQAVTENSMDLFEDDEAFLQMTIPDISTPAVTPRVSSAEGEANETKHLTAVSNKSSLLLTSPTCRPLRSRLNPQELLTPPTADQPRREHPKAAAVEEPAHLATEPKSFLEERSWPPLDGSHDFFSVNFDLGYSLEESEEEQDDIAAPYQPCEKTSVVGSSTPLSSFPTSRKAREVQSRGGNPHPIPSPLTSPVCLPRAQQVVATTTLHSNLKRQRPEFESSACGIGGSHPHPGWFKKKKK